MKRAARPRLLILSPFENQWEKRGTRNLAMAKLFDSRGWNVTILTTRFSHTKKRLLRSSETDNQPGEFTTRVFPFVPYRSNLSLRRVFSHQILALEILFWLLLNCRRRDSVIVSSIPPELVGIVAIVRALRGSRTYLDVRDIWPDALGVRAGTPAAAFFSSYCHLIYACAVPLYEHHFVVARSFRSWVSRYGGPESSTFIPLGFDGDRWGECHSDHAAFRKSIVYVGNLNYQFDLDPLIDALNGTGWNLTVVGGGERLEYYKRRASTGTVRFHGYVISQRVPALISGHALGVVPVATGGTANLPNKVFDYLAACLPMLTYGSPDTAHFVQEHEIGFAVGANSEEISATLLRATPQELIKMAARAQRLRHKYEKRQLYETLYEVIADNRARRSRKVEDD